MIGASSVYSVMGNPGNTVVATVGTAYTRLSVLYNPASPDGDISVGSEKAHGVTFQALDNTVEVTFSESQPIPGSGGYELSDQASARWVGRAWVKNCWVRNLVAANVGRLVITPEY